MRKVPGGIQGHSGMHALAEPMGLPRRHRLHTIGQQRHDTRLPIQALGVLFLCGAGGQQTLVPTHQLGAPRIVVFFDPVGKDQPTVGVVGVIDQGLQQTVEHGDAVSRGLACRDVMPVYLRETSH